MSSYPFKIGKMGKDFYEEKFGEKIMSAQKIKEMLTDQKKSNFNVLLNFLQAPRSSDTPYVIRIQSCYIILIHFMI